MTTDKGPSSFRLSDEAKRMLKVVAERYGTSSTGALEIAIRALYHAGVPVAPMQAIQRAVEEVEEKGEPVKQEPKRRGRPRKPPG